LQKSGANCSANGFNWANPCSIKADLIVRVYSSVKEIETQFQDYPKSKMMPETSTDGIPLLPRKHFQVKKHNYPSGLRYTSE
jgi:hypothetical protein